MENEIAQAVQTKLLARSSLVALLGAPAISGSWPDEAATYTATPAGASSFASLTSCDPPRARVVFDVAVGPTEDLDVPTHDDIGSIDIFSASKRLNAAIADEIRAALHRQPLTVSGARITEMFCVNGPNLYEPDTKLHHKQMPLRILWIKNFA